MMTKKKDTKKDVRVLNFDGQFIIKSHGAGRINWKSIIKMQIFIKEERKEEEGKKM